MKRYSLLSFALALPFAAVACGGSDDEGEGGGTPEGEHYRYVVNSINASGSNKLNIDGMGATENKLGGLVDTLQNFMLADVKAAIDEAVLSGNSLVLADLQTTSFSASGTAGFQVFLGDRATANPRPCTDDTMVATCGQHLMGTGSFTVAAASPRDAALTGTFQGGTLKGGQGKITIPIALTGAPITVGLVAAQMQLSNVNADGIGTGILGGALLEKDLNDQVLPQVNTQLQLVVERDCGPAATRVRGAVGTPPQMVCGNNASGTFVPCAATGAGILSTTLGFDPDNNCVFGLDDVKNSNTLKTFLNSDVTIDGQKGVSVVIGFTAKKATFTP